MHGELIFRHPQSNEELRVPGNALLLDDEIVRWEFHDRGLDEAKRREYLLSLEQVKSMGGTVSLVYVPASPPLEEVESGPEVSDGHVAPVDYVVVDLDLGSEHVVLRRSDVDGVGRDALH